MIGLLLVIFSQRRGTINTNGGVGEYHRGCGLYNPCSTALQEMDYGFGWISAKRKNSGNRFDWM